jgi:cyclohexyl-isocyanide hydratase
VIDRNRATGGGVTAGVDFGLALMARIGGEELAKMIQLAIEYTPAPPFDCGSPEAAGSELTARVNALFAGWMAAPAVEKG